jgi:hypothetical protein
VTLADREFSGYESHPKVSEESIPPQPQQPGVRDKVMFHVSGTLLVALTMILPHSSSSDQFVTHLIDTPWFWPNTIVFLWAIMVLEGLIGVAQASDGWLCGFRRFLLVILIPPMRMAFSPARPNDFVWYPRVGLLPVGRESEGKVELGLAVPMLIITLAVIPIFIAELYFQKNIAASPGWSITVHLVTGLIWLAFVVEFCLLLGVAENKLDYCRKHWINIVIIILPLVAFMRLLRLSRLVRVVKAGKMLRMYRLRGIYVRALRFAVLVNLVDRLLQRNPQGYLERLELKITDKEEELAELQEQAGEIRAKIATLEAEEPAR